MKMRTELRIGGTAGKITKIEFTLEQPPKNIGEVRLCCEIVEEQKEGQICESTEQEVIGQENPEQIAEESTFELTQQEDTKKECSKTIAEESEEPIEEQRLLESLVKQATSFKHFVQLIAQSLELGKRQDFFEELVMAATEVEKVSWEKLGQALHNKGVAYTSWDKIWTGRQIKAKLKCSGSMVTFLKTLSQYQKNFFCPEPEKIKERASDKALALTPQQSSIKQEGFATIEEEPIAKTEAVEKISEDNGSELNELFKIPCLQEIVQGIDKTKGIEDRTREVLDKMGLTDKSLLKQSQILQIANAAICCPKDLEWDAIFESTSIPREKSLEARMDFIQLVRRYMQKQGCNEQIKLIDFLEFLKATITK